MKRSAIALLLLGFLGSVACAGGIAVYPLFQEIILPPGNSYSDVIYVTNTGDEPMKVTVRALGFMAPEGTPILLEPGEDNYPYSGRDLLKLEPTARVVGPGETAAFDFTVAMPENLLPYGGRYVAAVFRAEPTERGEGQVLVAAQVASLFLLSPGKAVEPHLEIGTPQIYQAVDDPRKVVLEVPVSNVGNIHISSDQIRGYVYITDEFGYVMDEFVAHTHTILPDNSYIHREVWHAPEDLPEGTYVLHLALILFAPDPTKPQYIFISQPIKLTF